MTRATTVLVTGASGYAGERIAGALARAGRRVVGTRLEREVALPEGATLVRCDLGDRSQASALLREVKPEAVIHAAAMTDVARCQAHPEEARRAITGATRALCDAMAEHTPAARLVHLSTDLVFDGEHAPYGEDREPRPLSVYGQLKAEAEAIALARPGALVIRPALLYGPRSTHKPGALFWMVDRLRSGEPVSLFEDEIRTPAHVDDLSFVIGALLDRPVSGLLHLGSPRPIDRHSMGQIVCQALGLPDSRLTRARRSGSSFGAPRPRDVSLSCSRLEPLLGFRPRGFEEGARAELAKLLPQGTGSPRSYLATSFWQPAPRGSPVAALIWQKGLARASSPG